MGTIVKYDKKTGRHEMYIDQAHEKYYPIYHLLNYRANNIETISRETRIEFPYKKIDDSKYFVSQLYIRQTNELVITWHPYILTKKPRSWSLDIF